jgi:N-acetylglucosaminyl-diphospho-decaprenol L-rhamnosyltransferase
MDHALIKQPQQRAEAAADGDLRARPAVVVVIVNYRTATLAQRCLHSVMACRHELCGGGVVVVDNDSGDGSIEALRKMVDRERWHDLVRLAAAPGNGGFGSGNNIGFRQGLAAFDQVGAFLLLNPDAELAPGQLRRLLDRLHSEPRIGIVGAALRDARGQLASASHRVPSPLGELEAAAQWRPLSRLLERWAVTPPQSMHAHRCDWVSGACMLIRREALEATQGFDEAYFLYFEEIDLCIRAATLGWQCWFEPAARVRHLEGAATAINAVARRRPGYWYASRRRLLLKLYGMHGLVLADLLWAIGRCSLVLRRALGLGGRAGQAHEPVGMAHDLLLGDLRALFAGEQRAVVRIRAAA